MHLCIQAKKCLKKLHIGVLAAVLLFVSMGSETAWAAESVITPSMVPEKLRFWTSADTQESDSRDPYLTQATENLPDYSYTAAGSVIADVTPVTEKGVWKKAQPQQPVVPVTIYASKEAKPVSTAVNGDAVMVLEGEASYYSRAGCLGCSPNLTMANGQPLDDNALTMAIGANLKHLVGRSARVTNLVTNQSVNVKITDTGGFYQDKYGNRVADLTVATKQAIGMYGGVGQVRVEVF